MTRRYCDCCDTEISANDPRYEVTVKPVSKMAKRKPIYWRDVCGYCASVISGISKERAA